MTVLAPTNWNRTLTTKEWTKPLAVQQHRCADLLEAARPVLSQLGEVLVKAGAIALLTDAEGLILMAEGDPETIERARASGLAVGSPWPEDKFASSAVSATLAAGKPVQLCPHDRAPAAFTPWTCSAAVIRDPVDGETLGVLDLSRPGGEPNSYCLTLVAAEAQRIETNLAKLDAERHTKLLSLAFSDTRRWMDGGVVIFDPRGRLVHVNRHAACFLADRRLPADFWQSQAILRVVAGEEGGIPDWLRRDWFMPIVDDDRRLGTLLVLPAVTPAKPADGRPCSPLRRIVGESPAMQTAKARAEHLAGMALPVLLLGPTGAGKEVFAQAIHESGGGKGPFLPINCGAMSRDLLAAELFGYADGAFTGARRGGMAGKFEAADGGTLFLDEIGEMPLDLQAHLLRVLDDGVIYRVGESKPRRAKVRIIAATNRDLKAEAAAGRFRLDLFYRLAVAQITLPSLDERREDIPALAAHFIRLAALKYGIPEKPLGPGVAEALQAHDWPGNVRELRNAIESMMAFATGPALSVADLPEDVAGRPDVGPQGDIALKDYELTALKNAIDAEHGNLTRAAVRLGIAKSTLYEKLKRHGLSRG